MTNGVAMPATTTAPMRLSWSFVIVMSFKAVKVPAPAAAAVNRSTGHGRGGDGGGEADRRDNMARDANDPASASLVEWMPRLASTPRSCSRAREVRLRAEKGSVLSIDTK